MSKLFGFSNFGESTIMYLNRCMSALTRKYKGGTFDLTNEKSYPHISISLMCYF